MQFMGVNSDDRSIFIVHVPDLPNVLTAVDNVIVEFKPESPNIDLLAKISLTYARILDPGSERVARGSAHQ